MIFQNYQVHGSPLNSGAINTFVMCITRAPIPCLEVSYHHVSQGRRTYGGSQKRFPETKKKKKIFDNTREADKQFVSF